MLSYTVLAVTEAEAGEYFQLSNEAQTWDEGALMRGQRYVASTYNARWLAPFDNAAAPDAVKHAIFEAARREADVPGSLAADYQAPQQVTRERIDVIEVEYAASAPTAGLNSLLDNILIGQARAVISRTRTAYVVRA